LLAPRAARRRQSCTRPSRPTGPGSRAAAYAARRRATWPQHTAATRALGSASCRARASLADAEAREDLAEEIVGPDLASNRAEGQLRQSQLLREKLPAPQFGRGGTQVATSAVQRPQMALAGEEHRFAGRAPADGFQNCLAQAVEAGARLGGDSHRAGGVPKRRREIDLVVDVDARG